MVQTGTVPILPLLEAYLQARPEPGAYAGATGASGATGAAGAPVGRNRDINDVTTREAQPRREPASAAYAGATGATGASGATGAAGATVNRSRDINTGGAQALATDVVSLSREAMAEAWALERLARFAQGLGASAVPPSSRRALERMASELAATTAEKLDALNQRVTPIVAPLLESAPPRSAPGTNASPSNAPPANAPAARPATASNDAAEAAEPADATGAGTGAATEWPRLALRVFARAREADELTRRLFTESDAGLVELGPSVRQLIAACASGRQDALTLSERLTSQGQ
jgi:hypothetical protein